MASLVFDPREPRTAYAGVEGYEYWGVYPGGLFKTTDSGGSSWRKMAPEARRHFRRRRRLRRKMEPSSSQPVSSPGWGDEYVGTVEASSARKTAAETWTAAEEGLPSGLTVRSLAADPHVSGTLYAGTSAGVFRTRDGGRNWTPFGQRLAGSRSALSLDRRRGPPPFRRHDERRLRARDHARPDGRGRRTGRGQPPPRVGRRAPLDRHGGSGRPVDERFSGKPPATWTAVALAEGGGGRTRVLWQNGDGLSALEIVGPSGRQSAACSKNVPAGSRATSR